MKGEGGSWWIECWGLVVENGFGCASKYEFRFREGCGTTSVGGLWSEMKEPRLLIGGGGTEESGACGWHVMIRIGR